MLDPGSHHDGRYAQWHVPPSPPRPSRSSWNTPTSSARSRTPRCATTPRRHTTRPQAAYERLKKGNSPAAALFDDRKLQRELKTTGKSIANTRDSLTGKKRKRRRGRFLVLTLVGAALAIALSEGLRNKVLDALFGAEEEFDYVSTTAPRPRPRRRRRSQRRPRRSGPGGGGGAEGDASPTARPRSSKSEDAEPAATSGD